MSSRKSISCSHAVRTRGSGPGDRGEATAQEWADLLGTLSYDIVTRFTAKIPRSYCGVTGAAAPAAQATEVTGPGAGDHADVEHAGMQEV